MKAAEKILDAITVIIIVLIAAMICPMLFNLKPYVIMSGSMEPTLHTGSLTYVNQNIKAEEIKAGDIIAFKLGDSTVTHRAIEIGEESFVTKGDANKTEDLVGVSFKNYVGKIAYSIPYMGYVASSLKSPFVMAFIIALGIAQFIVTVLSDKQQRGGINEK